MKSLTPGSVTNPRESGGRVLTDGENCLDDSFVAGAATQVSGQCDPYLFFAWRCAA